jgi:outer membrane protein assembly factor BamD
MCHYKLMATPNRDQTNTHKLIQTYDRLLKKFPNSPYSQEAQVLRAEARNELALHEVEVARWYIKTHQIKQARLRLQRAINNYPETVAAGQAQELLSTLPPEEVESQQIEKPLLKRLFPFM